MKPKRFLRLATLAAGAMALTVGAADTYSIVATESPGVVQYSQAAGVVVSNDWTNGGYVPSAGIATNAAESCHDPDRSGTLKYTLAAAEVGFSWQRSEPEYYLSDVLTAPTDVDWKATLENYEAYCDENLAEGESPAFIVNPDDNNHCVYAVAGGTQKFVWYLKDGSAKTNTYNIASTCSGRPRRIFWTDSPYNGPSISLNGKFVKMFDNGSVTKIVKGSVTNVVGGVETVTDNTIVWGVYIDETAQVMYATGKPQGQFVLVYYDTGEYKNILCVEVIEVAKPEAITAYGTIGEALEPYGVNYDSTGLSAIVTAGIGDSDDNRGDYLYQHSGQYPYSPKDGNVYPLRPSVGARWKAEMYWLETDPMGVQWPFVLNQYENDWPEHGHLYVRGADLSDPGAKIYIPDDYEATLCDYQAPNGHAVAVDSDNAFYTTGEGWSLLKLTADDNVWFMPIHSILNTDDTYFTREPLGVTVGQEFRIGGGVRSGVAEGAMELITATDDAPGYIYKPASGTQYNADLYYVTTNATADADTQYSTDVVSDATSTQTQSAIFAVNEGEQDIEVWWSRREQQEDMPAWIDIPTLVQVYHPVWPDTTEAPTIVLASQLGSEGESVYQQYGAATFDKENAALQLAARQYFTTDGTGMVAFWTRPSAYADAMKGVTNAPSALLTLGNAAGEVLIMRITHDERLELLVGENSVTNVALPKLSRPNIWTHVALTVENAANYRLYLNAEEAAAGALPNAEFLKSPIGGLVGRQLDLSFTNALANAVSLANTIDPETLKWVECGTWSAVKENLLAGNNVKLTKNVTQDSNVIYFRDGQKAVLDLSGFTLTGWEHNAIFHALSDTPGAELTIIDTSLDGSGTIVGGNIACNGGAMFHVRKYGKLTINGGTFKNASVEGYNGGCVYVDYGGSFVMNGGKITDCQAVDTLGGAVLNCGDFTMNGGVIANCSAQNGGAVCQLGWGATFTMNGGVIRNCAATEVGGGVNIDGGTFTMTGGTMVSNTVNGVKTCVQMTGGTVTLQGGLLDVEPTAENVQVDGAGTFTEPATFQLYEEGLYKIGLGVAKGRQIAELAFRNVILSAIDLDDARKKILAGTEEGLTGYYSFRPGEDLASTYQIAKGIDIRHFHERVQGLSTCKARNCSLLTPGAPTKGGFVIDADETPSIYYRNSAAEVGYNPNEEHAFVKSGSGGYIAWALRCDLNIDASSKPGVLVQYVKDGEAKMQFFHVAVTNDDYSTLSGTCVAGRMLPGPKPITAMDDPWLPEDRWDRDPAHPDRPGAVYRDRKGQLYARCAGTIPIYMYYRNQAGFWFPQYSESDQPAVGAAVPWLSVWANPEFADNPMSASPALWTWTAKWPEVANVMKIGQTLYEAKDGLPGVYNMKSVAIIYPAPCEERHATETATLIDPTVSVSLSFDHELLKELGLTTDPNGGLTKRKGIYYFNELPPNLSSRISVDPTNDKLSLIGEYVKNTSNTEASMIHLNVLSETERNQLLNVVPETMRSGSAWETWSAAVAALGVSRVEPNTSGTTLDGNEVTTAYTPRDSYALTARGGTGWVVLIENDAPTTNFTATVNGAAKTVNMGVSAGDAINIHTLYVTNAYYQGYIIAQEDEQNLLSQRLSVLYTQCLGGDADDFIFEWRSAESNADGTVPENYDNEQTYVPRGVNYSDYQSPRITIGEQGDTLANMVNKYWICRYKAKEGTSAFSSMGDAWSPWCAPACLAEGWVQRVLNNVTPFNQLMTDLYENEAETAVSMIEKAGKPYTGDVAFNQDALTDCGLIELYETLFNKAESMSLLLGEGGDSVCEQLMLCAQRLDDMYTLLGDEAYSDAKNPTIGFGSTATFTGTNRDVLYDIDYGAASSGLFCFDNQVSSLLDEELALLRGRTADSQPYVTKGNRRVTSTGPYYNRLLWNFTKGVTAGEVAYAVNYNIEGTETTALSETQASVIYPQGHGDAYGHYLSALKGWYRLLRNPYFNWHRAQGAMSLASSTVNVDYYEEAKFATAALNLAKTAADVVDLTARKARADSDTAMAGYRDEMEERAFGYGEWANRGAYGALVNWAVANSLLPEAESEGTTGLMRIDRGTVDELAELCTQAEAIQCAEDRIDAGYNPLGLNDDAIPFDITPIGANDGTKTHFEQIRERAGTAVANARALLDKAQEYSNRLRMIQETSDSYEDAIDETEGAYNQELIGYYGKPYSDDIGPGATYEQGYDGPDLIHYMWMDISKYGLEDVEDSIAVNAYYFDDVVQWTWTYAFTSLGAQIEKDYNQLKSNHTMIFQQSASGLIVKPDTITGTRPMQGSIQDKYGEFLAAYAHFKLCLNDYEIAAKNYEYEAEWTMLSADIDFAVALIKEGVYIALTVFEAKDRVKKQALNAIEYANALTSATIDSSISGIAKTSGAGTTVVTDPSSFVQKATMLTQWNNDTKYASEKMLLQNQLVGSPATAILSYLESMITAGTDYYDQIKQLLKNLTDRADVVNTKYLALSDAETALVNAVEAYNSEVAKGEQVLERRENARKRQVNQIAQMRYNDMFFRQLRNQALSRYSASFDLAQKYVWEAAKAYDYETGLLSSDEASGKTFLDRIITSRALGSFDSDGNPIVGDVGDTGLAGILAEMDANWLVLKPRLGINNPQQYATWFSLRGECFRILSGEEGDAAWAKELTKYWTDDITSNAEFKRYCQPFQSQFGLKDQEPGLIIPFETTIDFAKNFFGNDLAGGDNAYDSTWYATRIYAAGVWFDGYNAKADGSKANALLANTPVVYLVPMGQDCMRVPGLEDGWVLGWNVVDQVIAAPYAIGSTHLNDLSWYPTASDGDLGGADETTKIRKHPSFRAYFNTAGGDPTDDKLDCTRLVGRSVWNTKWMLVIPAGSMNADRDKALSVFINGSDTNRDGKLDLLPVSDIKIGFKTYSNSGN